MSAPDPVKAPRAPLLLVIDPVARATDGESVRIARDVLCAGAPGVKVCLPDGPQETERMLARRGSRRPVVVGDDRALLRTVQLLHRERELEDAALSFVPVGSAADVAVARRLGVPPDAVQAARTVMAGVEHRLDLLIDDSGGVVLDGLRIPAPAPARAAAPDGPLLHSGSRTEGEEADSPWRRACRTLVRTMHVPQQAAGHLLRVEADGELLADLDSSVQEVTVSTGGAIPGMAEVVVRSRSLPESVLSAGTAMADPTSGLVRALARTVTVTGRDFCYRADDAECGPVRSRTWRVAPSALRLTVPAVPGQGPPPGGGR